MEACDEDRDRSVVPRAVEKKAEDVQLTLLKQVEQNLKLTRRAEAEIRSITARRSREGTQRERKELGELLGLRLLYEQHAEVLVSKLG